jgi:hypothetical protein
MRMFTATVLAALLLAGCTSPKAHNPAGETSSPAVTQSPASATATSTPNATPAHMVRLSREQAARLYIRLVHPFNRASQAAGLAENYRLPIRQFRADGRAYIAGVKAFDRKAPAVLWPRNTEPYIKAMVSTDHVAAIKCVRAEMRQRTYARVDSVAKSNSDCQAQANASNATMIRARLGLPPPK